MMRKIFWYVLGTFSRNFLLCLAMVLTIYLVVDFFEKLRKFLKYDAELSLILSFFAYRIPEIVFLLAPLGALMATILTVGGLNRTREITAMRSCGLSFYQIALPFFAFGLCVSVTSLSLTAVFIPLANVKAEYVKSVSIQQKPEALLSAPDSLWLRVGQTQLLHIDSVEQDGTHLTGLHYYTLHEPFRLSEIVEAETASFSKGEWRMEKVRRRQVMGDGRVEFLEKPHDIMALSVKPEDFQNWLSQSPQHMTLYQLHDYIERATQDGHNPQRYVTDYWARVAYSMVPLVMILLGVSIGLRGSGVRSVGVAQGLGQTLAIGFLFWAAHSVGIVLGKNGAVMPIVGSWIATVMFLMVGANLFLKLEKH
ncbi:MAG: LPS export ABC transporter permease LptG [Nitrospirota bacterium]|nr:LPS export ABC transporter permease LptG [Nitrospirota bacterium]